MWLAVGGMALLLLVGLGSRLIAPRLTHADPNRPAGPAESVQPAPLPVLAQSEPLLVSNQAASTPRVSQRLVSRRVFNYGDGDGEIGFVRQEGQTPVGPESFALDLQGRVWIADRVNQRILVCDRDGTATTALELPGVTLNDIATDAAGRLYVYDQVRQTLSQYDAAGRLCGRLELDPAQRLTRGYLHVVGSRIYFADAAQRDVLIGTVSEGILSPPAGLAEEPGDGIHGPSGRLYSVSASKGEGLSLRIRDPATPSFACSVEVAMPDLLAARYAGEDHARNGYVQVERWREERVVLEVLVFGPEGQRLGSIALPENDYALWTAKLVEARADGTLVQFLPAEAAASLSLYRIGPAAY